MVTVEGKAKGTTVNYKLSMRDKVKVNLLQFDMKRHQEGFPTNDID